ncbi:MAG TPA: hypothetical protein VEA41_08940, partial [Salinarimonas sp.]|nr:hypothetical protein [Salinarimonas sp.]
MKARRRSSPELRTLTDQMRRHERAADALAGAVDRFRRGGDDAAASLSLKACHAHRVWALMARARADALRVWNR